MPDRNAMVERFFPTREGRLKASKAIGKEVTRLLAGYPRDLVARVRALKAEGRSLREICDLLGGDSRVLEIAMHLAVENQAKDIGGSS